MKHGWLTKVGPYKVEHVSAPHPSSPVDEHAPPAGIMHTTEGSFESAMSVFVRHFAPTFMVGVDRTGKTRVVQFMPLGHMAGAVENHPGGVETNRLARVQIEVVGRSRLLPWLPDAKTTDALAALMGALEGPAVADIPLKRPYPDTMPPGMWATERFSRRLDGFWGRISGWFGHVEIPENSHWDPGALRWSVLLAKAKSYRIVPVPVPKPRPRITAPVSRLYWRWLTWKLSEGDFAEYGHANPMVRPVDLPQTVPSSWRTALADLLRRRK